MGMSVHVHRSIPDETDRSQSEFLGEFQRKAGRSGHRRNDRDASRQRFLGDFEAQTAADHQDRCSALRPLAQRRSYGLADGVVPPDVLPDYDLLALGIEQPRPVNPTRPTKVPLSQPEPIGQHQDDFFTDGNACFEHFELLTDAIDGRLSTQAATRVGP